MTAAMDSERKEEVMAHAEIIEACIGICKRWHVLVFLMVFLVNGPLAMQELSITLLAPPTKFNCSDPAYNKCDPACPSHTFDKSLFERTIITEWDLVCEKEWLENLAQTLLMGGVLVGNFVFGFFSDRYGRRKPLIIAVILEVISGIGIAFTTSFPLFLILRFLVATAAGGTLCTGFCLVVEIIGRKYRSTFGILFQMSYYVGHASLGLIGYYIRDWRYVQLTISLPIVVVLCYVFIVPESPRWLLSVGRLEQAIQVMEKAAKFNKMPTEHIRSTVMAKLESKDVEEENFLYLFKSHNVRIKTICIFFIWLILGLCFFGVAQYMGRIAGNIFVNIAIAGLIQIPGNFIIIFIIQIFGRKITAAITFAICGISCLLVIVVPTSPTIIISSLGAISMMGISLSFATVFVWTGEILATPVRNVGLGTAAVCAKIGSMVAPFIQGTAHIYYWIPPVIFGTSAFLAIIISLKLPETLDTKMPDSTEEAEQFGKSRTALV